MTTFSSNRKVPGLEMLGTVVRYGEQRKLSLQNQWRTRIGGFSKAVGGRDEYFIR